MDAVRATVLAAQRVISLATAVHAYSATSLLLAWRLASAGHRSLRSCAACCARSQTRLRSNQRHETIKLHALVQLLIFIVRQCCRRRLREKVSNAIDRCLRELEGDDSVRVRTIVEKLYDLILWSWQRHLAHASLSFQQHSLVVQPSTVR